MFHFTHFPPPVKMLNGPKCNLTFRSLHTLGQEEGRKKNHVRRTLGKHLGDRNVEQRKGACCRPLPTAPSGRAPRMTSKRVPPWEVGKGCGTHPGKWPLHMLLNAFLTKTRCATPQPGSRQLPGAQLLGVATPLQDSLLGSWEKVHQSCWPPCVQGPIPTLLHTTVLGARAISTVPGRNTASLPGCRACWCQPGIRPVPRARPGTPPFPPAPDWLDALIPAHPLWPTKHSVPEKRERIS